MSEPTTREVSESPLYRLYRTTYKARLTVAILPSFGSDAIIVTFKSETVCFPSTIDEPKALSSHPKDTTYVVLLKGVHIKDPVGGG